MNRGESSHHRTLLKRFLVPAVLLAVVVVSAGAVSLWRKTAEFQPLGFQAQPRDGHWLVTAVSAADSSLAVGDQIVLINGESFARVDELRSALRRRPVSELVVLREARLETLSHRLPPLEIDFPYLILALIGAGYLLIGFYTLLRDRSRPARVFYLWCLLSALVYLATTTGLSDWSGRAIYLLDGVALILLAPLTLHLFAIFPVPLGERLRLTRAVPFFYLPAVFLLALEADLIFLGGTLFFGGVGGAAVALLDRLEVYHLVVFSFAAVGVLAWRLQHTPRHENRRQVTWIGVGMLAGYAPFLALYVLPHTLGLAWPQLVNSLAVLPLALVPLTFAYSILRYKLWDIGVIVRNAMTVSLTVLTGVVGFSLANLAINRFLPQDLGALRNLLSFASGIGIAALLIPARHNIGSALERLHYGDSFARRRALVDFGRELVRERDLGRLCRTLLERLEMGLELRRANLLLNHSGTLMPIRLEPAMPEGLAADELADDLWDSDVFSLSGVELPAERTSASQRLYAAGYRYAFPLIVRDQWVGLMLSSHREGGIPLSSDDLDLIRNLLNQAGLAIENAELMDQLHRQLDEVVRLQRFSQGIIESTPAGIAVVDGEGTVLSANQAFARLSGAAGGDVTGRPLGDLLPIDAPPEPNEGMREVRVTDRYGRERHLQVSAAPLQDGEEGRVVVAQDVSERVAMENALKEKERLASLGMLAAGVAHEVNTPITGISSYAQMLLAETDPSDPRFELLQKVEKQTFRAANIVNNLLELARDRKGDHLPVDLAPVVEECLELQKERMQRFGITLAWRAPEEPVQVRGTEGELQQVINNLVVNAVDAMAGGGGELSVELKGGDERAWLTVEDTGPGMPPEDVEKVFKPFFTTKLGKGGTGLGLAISYNIVRRHEGELRVFSTPGEGSRFIVELPRHRPGAERSNG